MRVPVPLGRGLALQTRLLRRLRGFRRRCRGHKSLKGLRRQQVLPTFGRAGTDLRRDGLSFKLDCYDASVDFGCCRGDTGVPRS